MHYIWERGHVIGLIIALVGTMIFTGGCGHDWEGGAPVPAEAVLVNRDPDEGHWTASTRYWYNEQYVMNISPQAVQQFYEELGWNCTERSISFDEAPSSPDLLYWHCEGSLNERITVYAQIVHQSDATNVFESIGGTAPTWFRIFRQEPEQTDPPAETVIFTQVSNNVGTW